MVIAKYFRKFILLMMVVFLGCTQDEFNVSRPSSVPPTAQLVGGIDGWDWVDCKPTSEIHLECKIYDRVGGLSRTSYLRPCFNIRVKNNNVLKVSRLDETLIYFREINLYEYKPSVIHGEPKNSDLAMKYYRMLGVNDSCNISSSDSELISLD